MTAAPHTGLYRKWSFSHETRNQTTGLRRLAPIISLCLPIAGCFGTQAKKPSERKIVAIYEFRSDYKEGIDMAVRDYIEEAVNELVARYGR